ncbi:acid-shock protein [Faecalibacterium prausnitzii]|uniref:acid-shock protein n=1 Tax=Faecalibacterium prausnitzii TaxID=853 RepID=UPI001FA8123A|nr:acid-shock protein [Faecalibacterium prausnitzii]MCI3184239.1 acid-shock protein [Faecalibacterium prausnitzii]MCI3200941.1 acid-shock protein [Faecalibacterium prausnitzii]
MKYQHLVSLALAAALLLAGCGGTQSSPSAAADQSSDSSRSTPGAVTQAAQTDRITDQYTLEKNVSGVWGEDAVQYISVHVPQLECDSPDAAYINDELNAIYAADFREYETYEEAELPDGEVPQIGVNWDDWWYGDCVSLVVRSRYGGTAPWRYSGWCFDFATGQQITVAEMLQRMGLDPDTVQEQVQRLAMQAFDREMAQGAYYEGLRLGGELSQMRMDTLEYNELENLCLLLPQQDQLVLRGKYSCEEGWQQLDMELSLPPADTPVLTDTYDGVQVQLEGTQATITLSPAPKTDQWGDIGIRVEQEHSYPILGAYNEYVDVRIGEQEDGFFRPVVYLLTKDGVVEYVDVLRCLMFGDAMICQDPIYFANNGVSLERSGSEVNLRRADGSVLELAPLSAEWSAQEIPYSVIGSYNYTDETGWSWMDLTSDGSVQMGMQDNSRMDQGDAAYLGVVPEGVVLGISTDAGLEFVAAFKMDLYNENLTMTMIAGQNPFAEGETQLQMTRSYG